MKWDKEKKKLEMVCPRGGRESTGVADAGGRKGGMTGYSVSEVAHGEQVNIRDRPEKVIVKRVGKYSIWDGTYDAGRKAKRVRFEDIVVLLLPDGAYGGNGTRARAVKDER
jgi:hypothetical protein